MVRPMPRSPALALALACLALFPAGCSLGDDDEQVPSGLGASAGDENAAVKLGFPAIATKNTTRVGGGDATADVAGAVNAVFPATSDDNRPRAVVLVDKDDWQGAVAAAVLMGRPLSAPTLLSDGEDLPAASEDALRRLNPRGADLAKDAQVIRIGVNTPKPSDRRTAIIRGGDPFERAAAIDRFQSAARGRPSADVLVVSAERPEYALPAAAWAARSGDAVLFVRRGSVPTATSRALARHEKPDIFVLGPESVIGGEVTKALKAHGRVRRIEGPTPVQNAIAFARYQRSGFGWGITVPGQNFTLASTDRPADAAAAAALGTQGVFAPLLLTDDDDRLPRSLESYLLDLQPGFEQDPNSSVFNHVWILGDERTISVDVQGRVDEITQLVPVEINRP
jgi:ell wall binding domain 2 (CWB2)